MKSFRVTLFCASFALSVCSLFGSKFAEEASKASYYVKLNKTSSNSLDFCLFKHGNVKFCKSFQYNFSGFKDYSFQDLYLSRSDDWINCHIYDDKSEVLYDFAFNFNGDIDLSCGNIFTGNNISYAFSTKEGKIINNNVVSFKSIVTLSKEFRNESVLKLNRGGFFAKYHYNHGVIDFKSPHTSGRIDKNYAGYLCAINSKKKTPAFKEHVFDNYGIIFGKDLQASNKEQSSFKFNNAGGFFANSLHMNAQSSSIFATGNFSVRDTVQGNVSDLNVGQCIMRIGKLVANNYITNFSNSGHVVFDKSVDLKIKSLKNSGMITGLENLTMLAEAISGNGMITAEKALNLIEKTKREIRQKIDKGANDVVKLSNGLLSRNTKVTIRTDHYLNTITDYYYRNGGFSHRTETGYIFQYSTEEAKDMPLPAQAAEALNAILSQACKALNDLDNAYNAVDGLGEAILKGMLQCNAKYGSAIPRKIALNEALNEAGYSSADRSAAVNTLLSVPYSANVLRSSGDISDIFSNPFMNFDRLYKEYSDYKYEEKKVTDRSRRKSWNDADHVRVIKDASCEFSMEALVANATRARYELEMWKERNPETYENFLKIVRVYNNATLAGTAFSAILAAPETGGTSLVAFGLGASLFAGIEYLAEFIAEEGSEKIAQYCAKGNKEKESSYVKTCDFILKFVSENGLIFASRTKILKESVKKVGDRYPRNAEYADNHHSKTKIPFNEKGFPVFDSVKVCDLKIEASVYAKRDRNTHFKRATSILNEMLKNGEISESVFTREQLAAINANRAKIPGYTWHHHEDLGRMQLVPESIHRETGHTGGFEVWYAE